MKYPGNFTDGTIKKHVRAQKPHTTQSGKEEPVATIGAVIDYIRAHTSNTGKVKLQKLLYYSHVWALVWSGEPLTGEKFYAWKMGPVIPTVWQNEHLPGDCSQLTDNEKKIIESVLDHYGTMTGKALSELAHSEKPWKTARIGYMPDDSSNVPLDELTEIKYYSSLPADRRPAAPVLAPTAAPGEHFRAALAAVGRLGPALELLKDR